jgi:hypothetical protein
MNTIEAVLTLEPTLPTCFRHDGPAVSRLATRLRAAADRDRRDEWRRDAADAVSRRLRLNGRTAKNG